MANVPGLTATFGPILSSVLPAFAIISTPLRNIGGMYPDVTVEEIHRDEMSITQHPVETGAPVSDHAFMQPVTVEIRCGWSNASHQSEGYVQTVYSQLQKLQDAAQPFNVQTGKRLYKQMLIRSLLIRTNAEFENSLMVIAYCQQVIIVSTQAATGTVPQSNGSARVGGPNGMDNGADSPAPGAFSPDENGDYTVPNNQYGAGNYSLKPTPTGPLPPPGNPLYNGGAP